MSRILMDFVRGTTFDLAGQATMGGVVFDFSGWNVPTCKLKTTNIGREPVTLVVDMVCEWVDAATGLLRIHCASSTAGWPVGELVFDVRFTDSLGNVVQTTRVYVNVVSEVTNV